MEGRDIFLIIIWIGILALCTCYIIHLIVTMRKNNAILNQPIRLTGKVIKKRFTDDYLTFTLKNNKTLPLTYYIKNKKELKEYKKITLGSIIRVTGTLKSNNYLIVKNIKILERIPSKKARNNKKMPTGR